MEHEYLAKDLTETALTTLWVVLTKNYLQWHCVGSLQLMCILKLSNNSFIAMIYVFAYFYLQASVKDVRWDHSVSHFFKCYWIRW